MTGKYTPGPWVAEMQENGDWFIVADRNEVIATMQEWSPAVDKADARLIAAAPDLLEALRKITLAVAMQEKDQLYPDTREGWMMAADDIEAIALDAIAKAEVRA